MILSKEMIPDTIAVVYELTIRYNNSGYLFVDKVSIKKDNQTGCYYLDPKKTYLILCAKSRFRVENNILTCTFNSISKYTIEKC